jgi:hypothetical protein
MMGGKEILQRFAHKLRPGKPAEAMLPPFDSIQELVVARVIATLQNRNGSAGMKATIDQIGSALERDEISDSLRSLERKEIVVRNENRFEITHNGEIALQRAIEAQRDRVQQFLDRKHSGIAL